MATRCATRSDLSDFSSSHREGRSPGTPLFGWAPVRRYIRRYYPMYIPLPTHMCCAMYTLHVSRVAARRNRGVALHRGSSRAGTAS